MFCRHIVVNCFAVTLLFLLNAVQNISQAFLPAEFKNTGVVKVRERCLSIARTSVQEIAVVLWLRRYRQRNRRRKIRQQPAPLPPAVAGAEPPSICLSSVLKWCRSVSAMPENRVFSCGSSASVECFSYFSAQSFSCVLRSFKREVSFCVNCILNHLKNSIAQKKIIITKDKIK